MSHFDIKNYLEKIYKVPVLSVRTEVRNGEYLYILKVTYKVPLLSLSTRICGVGYASGRVGGFELMDH